MSKAELIKEIKDYKRTDAKNSMGCSENWYSFVYAMKQTFTIEEIEQMTDEELKKLERLADNIQEGLY